MRGCQPSKLLELLLNRLWLNYGPLVKPRWWFDWNAELSLKIRQNRSPLHQTRSPLRSLRVSLV
jgi:hypothetical protein